MCIPRLARFSEYNRFRNVTPRIEVLLYARFQECSFCRAEIIDVFGGLPVELDVSYVVWGGC